MKKTIADISHIPFLMTKENAQLVAQKNQDTDEDGWKYSVVPSDIKGYYFVSVSDENNVIIGSL